MFSGIFHRYLCFKNKTKLVFMNYLCEYVIWCTSGT